MDQNSFVCSIIASEHKFQFPIFIIHFHLLFVVLRYFIGHVFFLKHMIYILMLPTGIVKVQHCAGFSKGAVPFLEFGRLSNFGMAADLQRDRLQRDFDALKSIDGNIASIVYGNALKQETGAEYDAAALTIQCGWRCYVARKITLDLLFEKFERDLSFYEQHSKSQVEEGDILMREQSLEASWLCRQLADRNRRFARNYAATVIQRCWRLARGKGISSHKPKNAPLRSRKGSNLTVHVPFFPESASSWLMTPKSQYGSYTNSPLVSVVAAESD